MLYLDIQRRNVLFANNSLFFLISEVTMEEDVAMEELKVVCIVSHLHRRVCAQPFFIEAIELIVSDIILLGFYYLSFTRLKLQMNGLLSIGLRVCVDSAGIF